MRLAVLLALCLAAAACGVRGSLDRPEGATYPRTYPAE